MKRRTACLAACLATALLAGCGTVLPGGSDDRVTLEFFQFKPEAVATFDRIIERFEAEHPDIRVVQYQPPNAETAIRARMVKDNVPDVMTLNGNSVFGELASAGVFHDFSEDRAADRISPAIQRVLDDLGTARPGEVNGLPFASNASGVLYNKELFAKHGVGTPATWDEFIAAAKTFEKAGVTPFYGAMAENWTSLNAFNPLASNLPSDDFWERREAGRTSFREDYPEVADKLAAIYEHTQRNTFSRDYNAANQAFARGGSAMYVMGSFALPAIKAFEPEFELGTFALPTGDDPDRTRLVSGVDIAVTMGREPDHPAESKAFVDYLMRPGVVNAYAEEQSAIPPLKGTEPSDPVLRPLMPYFARGRIVGFADHRIPLAVPLKPMLQQFLIDGKRDAFLRTLDDEFDKVRDRRS